MYRNCIHCSGDLGRNDSVEAFPVGARLAFDAWKGRLWVVCPKCGRWNLTPLEERWEAVEACEKLFRDTRLRVQRENIGLAKLADGTKLIRIGEALPGEVAAWRYGDALLARRQKYVLGAGLMAAASFATVGLTLAGPLVGAAAILNIASLVREYRKSERVIGRIPAEASPTGEALELRRFQLNGAWLTTGEDGKPAVVLPHALDPERGEGLVGAFTGKARPLVLEGDVARVILARAMPFVNEEGATRGRLRDALRLLESAGGVDAYLARVVERGGWLGIRDVGAFRRPPITPRPIDWDEVRERRRRLPQASALALEMALNEEAERRALEGELAALRAAWKHAEEIAAIADSL